MLGLNDELYKKYSAFIKEKTGIEYGPDKKNVLYNRLMPLLLEYEIDSYIDYYDYLISDASGKAIAAFISKVTTNHTYFYREHTHFEFLKNTVFLEQDRLIRSENRDIRYWVAASSTGEESYTLAMMLYDYFGRRGINKSSILATDISRKVVEKAIAGIYRKSDIEKLPEYLQNKYFTMIDERMYAVADEVKKMVMHRVLNLIRDKFPFTGKFDVIFIRNVMIYFDEGTRQKLMQQVYDLLMPGGYLFIGQTEALQIKINNLRQVFPSVYKKAFINEK